MLQYSLIKDEKWNMKIYVLDLNTVHHLPDEVAPIVTNVLVIIVDDGVGDTVILPV